MSVRLDSYPQTFLDAVRANCTARLGTLRTQRVPWWTHWAQLAEMFLPRRYRWFITPNQYNRGSPMNQSIVDETGVLAARTLATGLLANLTSPTKQWFKLGIRGLDITEESEEAVWLAECTKRMLAVYAASNLYNALGTAYHDNAVFGSAALIQYEDDEDVVRFYNPCLGEFFFGLDNRLTVDTLFREYTYTIQECVEEFGLGSVSESIRTAYKSGGSNRDMEVIIGHAIEPNNEVYQNGEPQGTVLPPSFAYREVYWEQATPGGKGANTILRISGFKEKPHVGFRWDVTSNDAYGRSPGMDALPAVRQLQIMARRQAEAIDKMVRPPMVASVSMRNEPMNILPGGVSFVADPSASGFKPAFTVEPRIQEMMENIQTIQARVGSCMFNDLFRMISDLQTVRTATEIEAREQEKLILLGPVVERTENEGLDDIIERTFAIMSRRGLFPPPPPTLAGAEIDIEYISILAASQRAASTAAIERVFAFAGNLVAVVPRIMDNLDPDEGITDYANLLNTNPKIINAAAKVKAIRDARSQQQQAAAALTAGATLASGAKTLSETEVGGGQSALNMVLQ